MAQDSSFHVRRALIAALKADTDLAALVPSDSIYPGEIIADPAYPLIMFTDGEAAPLRRSCIDGATIPVTFTAYAKPRYEERQMVETAEDVVRKISAQISKALDRKKFTLGTDYEAVAHTRWQGSIHRRNGGESNAWQAVVRFSARVIA